MPSKTIAADTPATPQNLNRKRKAGPALARPLKPDHQIDAKGHITPAPVSTPAPQADSTLSKQDKILNLLRRPEGVGLTDIMTATGWQAHSCRGFLSGTIKKKLGLALVSELDPENRQRRYRIVEAPQ